MRATTSSILVLALAALAAGARVAAAETGAVVVYGKAKAHDQEVVASAVAESMRAASWTVAEAALSPKDLEAIITCTKLDSPWSCIAPTADANRVQRISIVQVDPDPKGKAVVLTGQVLFPTDGVPSIEQRFCEPPCSARALGDSARELMKVLIDRASARGGTGIEIATVPPGASITLDGVMVGASDGKFPVSAGVHQLQLQRSGYRPISREVTVTEGQVLKLAYPLQPTHDGGRGGGARSRVPPVLLGSAGAIALVGGIAYSLSVDPPTSTSVDQPKKLYSGPALAVAAAGGAALGVAVYLWFRKPKPRSTPAAQLTHHGAVIGWSSSF
ncbi:MAG: PEGA domain-containing protein [Deltaproteobacteria bacterium]|nr:PEGA domain-containing protein [Deltaproteobacteria bacterium]